MELQRKIDNQIPMKALSSGEARKNFANTLNQVAYDSQHIAIKRQGKETVYMISATDYEHFQQLLQQEHDQKNTRHVEQSINHPEQKMLELEDFFADLEL